MKIRTHPSKVECHELQPNRRVNPLVNPPPANPEPGSFRRDGLTTPGPSPSNRVTNRHKVHIQGRAASTGIVSRLGPDIRSARLHVVILRDGPSWLSVVTLIEPTVWLCQRDHLSPHPDQSVTQFGRRPHRIQVRGVFVTWYYVGATCPTAYKFQNVVHAMSWTEPWGLSRPSSQATMLFHPYRQLLVFIF